MADKKITQLDPAGVLAGTEVLPIVQGGVTKKVTAQAIADLGGGGGGAVSSVNGQTGVVVLTKSDVGLANVDNTSDANKPVSSATQTALNLKANISSLSTVATSGAYNDLSGKPTLGTAAAQNSTAFASAAQGLLADTAVQPGDLATVATTGAYADLTGKPTLGTAADNNEGDFATAAQGALADTAVQPATLTSALADRAKRVAVPTNATDPGTLGEYAVDSSYAYFCISTNTWVRVPVSTWP